MQFRYLFHRTSRKKLFRILLIQIIIFLFSFSFLLPSVNAYDANVIIILDKHNVEHIIGPNSSLNICISGNVTCDVEGLGESVQRVELDLWATNYETWYSAVGPSHMTFYSDGRKKFNLSISIPIDTYNNTKNTVIVDGQWRAEPYYSVIDSSGYPTIDSVNVTVIREWYIGAPTTTTPLYEEYDDFWEGLDKYQRATIMYTPVIIIIVIITVLFYRKKKLDGLLLEK